MGVKNSIMSILQKLKNLFKKGNKEEKVDDEILTKADLDEKQKVIDKLYAEQGSGEPSDEVLEKQIELNQLRNKLDIPDESNFIYEDFVQ